MSTKWEKDPLSLCFTDEVVGKHRMHIRKFDLHDWLRIYNTYIDQMKVKHDILKTNFKDVFVTNNDDITNLAKEELFEMIVDYLPERFPTIFSRCENFIENKALGCFVSTHIRYDEGSAHV